MLFQSHITSPPAAAPMQVAPPPSTAKKARAKVEKVETSLAALILSPYKARPSSCNALTARNTRENWAPNALNAEALAAPPSTSKKGGIPLPKSTPIRRKAKPTEVCMPTCADNKICEEVQGQPPLYLHCSEFLSVRTISLFLTYCASLTVLLTRSFFLNGQVM